MKHCSPSAIFVEVEKLFKSHHPRNKTCILCIWVRVFWANALNTAAGNYHTVASSQATVLPQDKLSVGSMSILAVVFPWVLKVKRTRYSLRSCPMDPCIATLNSNMSKHYAWETRNHYFQDLVALLQWHTCQCSLQGQHKDRLLNRNILRCSSHVITL